MAVLVLPLVPAAVVEEMFQAGATRPLEAGQTLYDEGIDSQTVYVIIAGVMKLLVYSPSGTLALVALRGLGDFVGQHGALDGRPRASGAQALVQCELLSITSERFRGLVRAHPDLAMATLSGLSRQIRDATRHIAELNVEQAPVLVARRLLQLSVSPKLAPLRIADTEPIVVRSSLSQRDLAAWAGVSERSAGTVLHDFRDQGLIWTGRLRIEIHDLNGLRRAAGLLR